MAKYSTLEEMQRAGGLARAKKLSKERRIEIAKIARAARTAKDSKQPASK